jgi:NADH:ubiquinone oxidoreductase subunit 5 (subunit L)/multisubunit Na+/H+ antiporter MnhA subunit
MSALIHAATVVADVYMIAATMHCSLYRDFTMTVITIIGLATALVASVIRQNDIKVLTYSTVNQRFAMFSCAWNRQLWRRLFHVLTHPSSKALMFLGVVALYAPWWRAGYPGTWVYL